MSGMQLYLHDLVARRPKCPQPQHFGVGVRWPRELNRANKKSNPISSTGRQFQWKQRSARDCRSPGSANEQLVRFNRSSRSSFNSLQMEKLVFVFFALLLSSQIYQLLGRWEIFHCRRAEEDQPSFVHMGHVISWRNLLYRSPTPPSALHARTRTNLLII